MTLVNYIVGANVTSLEQNEVVLETTRRSQEIRTSQGLLTTSLAILIGLVVVISLWNRADNSMLLFWGLAVMSLAAWHFSICKRLRKTLTDASPKKLIQNEADLVFTGLAIPALVGASVWLFGLSYNREIVIILMMLCILCAIGSSLKTVAQRRAQALMVILNLGQAVLFLGISGEPVYFALSILVTAFISLLMVCAKRTQELIIGMVSSDIEVVNQSKIFLQSQSENEAALREAIDANKAKNRFLAAASHDLRQPLHALSLFVGNLKESLEGDEKQSALVRGIEDTADMLKQQFDGVVDIARFDADAVTVDRKHFDLYELCELLLEAERISAEEKNINICVTGDRAKVDSDPVLLGRLISNLISNAIKYTTQGTVKISLEQSENQVVLRVTDSGCGFPVTERERIFSDFVQLNHSGNHRGKGVGLGLAVVRRIATLLKVELQVNSIPGVGSEFVLLIPHGDLLIASLHRKGF